MKRYNPKDIESKWQKYWDENGTYVADLQSDKPKYYGFAMFNYPSGAGIHLGHAKNFTIPDILMRFKRQNGFEAYSPIGFDSFGLPAENYAIKTGQSPRKTTDDALASYRNQYRKMGWGMDWTKEIDTSKPDYYKWTQWCFLQLHNEKLAYQKESLQWWCDQCKTVLADEQVITGKCWRHDTDDDPMVTKRSLNQWFFKITEYADEILDATDDLNWTPWVKTAQKNWIGRSEGAEINFAVKDSSEKITVYTTRADTIFSAAFMVLAPEHHLVESITTSEQMLEVKDYVEESTVKSDLERMQTKHKTGVFTGAYAINPANGEEIPVWIADFVLAGYGTGAVFGDVHDERDLEFVRKYKIPAHATVLPEFIDTDTPPRKDAETVPRIAVQCIVKHPTDNKFLMLKKLQWQTENLSFVTGGIEDGEDVVEAAKRELFEETGHKAICKEVLLDQAYFVEFYHEGKKVNRRAKIYTVVFELENLDKDDVSEEEAKINEVVWLDEDSVSAKVHGEGCRLVFKHRDNLLPAFTGEGILVESGEFTGMKSEVARGKIIEWLAEKGSAKSKVNYKLRDWLISRQRYWGAPIPIIHCEDCGAVPVPEKNLPVLLPELENYHPSGDGRSPLANDKDWVNTKCPKCDKPAQRETDTMDGYVCSSWYQLRYLSAHDDTQAWDAELAKKWMGVDFYNGADHATAHLLYARFFTRFFYKQGLVGMPEPFERMYLHAKILASDGTFFSKSKGNGIDPLEVINSGYGADALRTYISFIAPPDVESPWNNDGLPSCYRFINRVWMLVQEFSEAGSDKEKRVDEKVSSNPENNNQLLQTTHKAIKKVSEDIEAIKYNTAVSAMMECVNGLYKVKDIDSYTSNGWQFALESIVQLMAPFAPHTAEELWRDLGHEDSVHIDHWPVLDEQYLIQDTIKLAVQVNGKVRAEIEVDTDASKEEIEKMALEQENVITHLQNKKPTKVIYVPGRLVSVVV